MKKILANSSIGILLILFGFNSLAQNPTYLCRIENATQVSCNVYEFDMVMQRTGTTPLYLAMIQAGININPAIIPAGATVNVDMVPGSSVLSLAMKPTPDRFVFDASEKCICLKPNAPSYANRTTITNNPAGTRVCRFRIACSQPFIPAATNHTWSFSITNGYSSKVFAYVGTTNTDITVQASHTVNAATGNITLTNSGFPDPMPQNITADTTVLCLNSGVYPVISMSNTQAGYTYYLYKNDTLVSGVNGVCFGTGAAASFGYQTTAGVYTAKSISCNGMIDMTGSVTITNVTPQVPSVSIYSNHWWWHPSLPSNYDEYCVYYAGDTITLKAVPVNGGLNPSYIWYVNNVAVGTDSTYTFIADAGFSVYCEMYSSEYCVTSSISTSRIANVSIVPPLPQIFNVSGGGAICQGDTAHVTLSGSEPGVTYWLSTYPWWFCDPYQGNCQPLEGTGQPLVWNVTEPGHYFVLVNMYPCTEGVPYTYAMSGSASVISTTYPIPEERTICEGEIYHWHGNDYSVTGSYNANYQSITGCDSNFAMNLNVVNPADKKLNIIFYLEGLSLDNGWMRQAQGVSENQFGEGIADKVRVELHSASAPYEIAYSFDNIDLKTDGRLIIDSFPCDIFGKYYLVIKHRNSIETWSSEPLGFGEQAFVSYNFNLGVSFTYGGNVNSNGSPLTIWGGDVSQDGVVDGSDMAMVDNASKPPVLLGYYPEDVNGDGVVDGSDLALVDNNSSNLVQVRRP